ncbi:Vacuolar protein sorting-associated protein 13C, partial [Armadillidium vulgare]
WNWKKKLFDNISITISCLQVIFADSGDEWRSMRSKDDSELHLIPRVKIKTNLANNVYPQLKEYPDHKMDIHVSSLKLKVAENRIDQINEFRNNFPLINFQNFEVHQNATYPKFSSVSIMELNHIKKFLYKKKIAPNDKPADEIPITVTPEFLRHVKNLKSFDTISQTSLELANYFPEESDDEIEKLNKPVDQLGFEDNTSPNNVIKVLFRLCMDEITLCVSLFANQREVPYVMVTFSRCLIESALMEYGPAIQVTVGSMYLVDKYHHNISGQYLEILSSGVNRNIFSLLYRKVYANCPDFKSHFHSCEQSFVVDISSVHLVWQHSAITALLTFISECSEKLKWLKKPILTVYEYFLKKCDIQKREDPPVPSGATKWSINGNLSKLTMNICDSERDLFHIKICGLTGGCVFKANDKYILRITLTDFLLEDLSDCTLYNRIIEIEEDRVFEIKFVKYNPCFRNVKSHSTEISCKSDFSLSIQIGRLQCVLLYKVFKNLSQLISCVFSKSCLNYAYHYTENSISKCFHNLSSNKMSISLQIHIPTLLVPQKSDSPSLLVFSLGDIKADNFFKSVSGSISSGGTVENILFEIGPAEIYRAVMALTGDMELQEAILEQSIIRIDLKRSLMRPCRDVLSWDATVSVNPLYINIGQRDLNTILCILGQNKLEANSIDNISNSRPNSPVDHCKIISKDDDCVDKLQDFLNRSIDIYKTSLIVIYFDSIHITLFNDMNEILSSPVRDSATALCKIEFGEIDVHVDVNNDNSLELKSTVQSVDIFDIRADSTSTVKKLFGQFSVNELSGQSKIRFNKPHLLDVSIRISPSGDLNSEISLDKIRMNLSMGFILALYAYISNSIPKEVRFPEDTLNLNDFSKEQFNEKEEDLVSINSSCSTSGYLSTGTSIGEDQRVLSISFKAKLPEILFFVDPEETESRIFVLRFHVQGDYSKHPASECFKIYFDKVTLFATSYSKEKITPYIILPTSYFEASWTLTSCETETITLLTSNIRFNLCSTIVQMINDVILEINEARSTHHPVEFDFPVGEREDLWSPKPLQPKYICSKLNKILKPKNHRDISSHQKLTLKFHSFEVVFEKNEDSICPVFCFKFALNLDVYDWRKAMYIKGDIPISILYFNSEFSCWEHILDPIPNDPFEPTDLLVRALTFRSLPIGVKDPVKSEKHDTKEKEKDKNRKEEFMQNSDSSSEDELCATSEMVILKPSFHNKQGVLKKEEDSDDDTCDVTSDEVTSHDVTKVKNVTDMEENVPQDGGENKNETLGARKINVVNGVEGKHSHLKDYSSLSTLFIISSKDKLNFSLTSKVIKSFCDLYDEFFNSKTELNFTSCNDTTERRFKLVNEIGPNSKVLLLYSPTVDNPIDVEVLAEANFQDTTITTSRPGSSLGGYSSEGSIQEKDVEHIET